MIYAVLPPAHCFVVSQREFQEPGSSLDTRCICSARRRKRHARDMYVCITFILETEKGRVLPTKVAGHWKVEGVRTSCDAEERLNVYRNT